MKEPGQEEIEKNWREQEEKITSLLNLGAEKFFTTAPHIEKAFRLEDRTLRCVDEGTPGGIHLAGSGILLGEETAARLLEMAKIDGVYSHAECGAAALYAKEKGLNESETETIAENWAETIAKRLSVPYRGKINKIELQRPNGFHIARVLYYDGTGRFDFSQADLPPGFIISRKYLDSAYAQKEAKLAMEIAFGDHGFKNLFSKNSPFLLIAIADPDAEDISLEDLKGELKNIASEKDNAVIDGFIAPINT